MIMGWNWIMLFLGIFFFSAVKICIESLRKKDSRTDWIKLYFCHRLMRSNFIFQKHVLLQIKGIIY